jgi:pyruvate/2-oxoglutarate dehydrogenase complex dihydrolipoamide acyltransferase (E2) component
MVQAKFKSNGSDYKVLPFPRMRQLVIDAGWMGKRKQMMHGFIEVDVTGPRRIIREQATQTGEQPSFSAFVLTCIGQAVAQDKLVHAYRNWRNQLIIFDDVDVLIAIEVETDGRTFPILHPVRAVNRRTVGDIHNEIRAIQAKLQQSEGMQSALMRTYHWLPAFLRHLGYRLVEMNPHWRKQYAGTVGLTSVGMFGRGGGWGIGMPSHSLAITLGGIAEKPGWINGRVELREYLCITLSFDHDVIDGAPAARFSRRLIDLIESSYGLCHQEEMVAA